MSVSEETGEVSYIKDGEFELFKDYNELNQKMKKDLS
jgi:diadenylate cyclase